MLNQNNNADNVIQRMTDIINTLYSELLSLFIPCHEEYSD